MPIVSIHFKVRTTKAINLIFEWEVAMKKADDRLSKYSEHCMDNNVWPSSLSRNDKIAGQPQDDSPGNLSKAIAIEYRNDLILSRPICN